LSSLRDAFWLRPALLVLGAVLLGEAAVLAEARDFHPAWLPREWLYSGGPSGARALLSAVGASAIGVAGTVFSITIAAMSLASGQMGPRLLRNFVRDGGNQLALGIFVATFGYCLIVLRTVRAVEEEAFVPHLGVTVAVLLGLLCVATLVWFVHHVARSISVDAAVAAVHADLLAAIARHGAREAPEPAPPPPEGGKPIRLGSSGYLRAVDERRLLGWAAARGAVLVLHARAGDYLFAGEAVGRVSGAEADAALEGAFTVGEMQSETEDLEYAARQLVEIAVRAMSPGINDPFTAIGVVERLGEALSRLVPLHLPGPAVRHAGRVVLHRSVSTYAGLCDATLHMIRQGATDSPAVLIRMMVVLHRVLEMETRPERRDTLRRHAELVRDAARRGMAEPADLAVVEGIWRQQLAAGPDAANPALRAPAAPG
jgi:uncharacterized membrane protein